MIPKVSVIVPVYNSEKFIGKCIESILDQGYKSFELILVDDGSTDSSSEICKSYAKKDERIIFCSKENGGPSSARNYALKQAKGDFVTFVDSDDYILHDYLEVLINLQSEQNYDWVACSYKNIYKTLSSFRSNITEWDKDITISENKKLKNILSSKVVACPSGRRTLASPTCKLYRNSIIRENKLFFDEKMMVCEDQMFNLEYVKFIKSFAYVNRFLYIRKINEGSLMTGFRPDMLEESKYLFKVYDKTISELGFEPLTQHQFILEKIREVLNLYVFHKDNKENRKEVYGKFWRYMKSKPLRSMWDRVDIMMFRGKRYKAQAFVIKSKALCLWPLVR